MSGVPYSPSGVYPTFPLTLINDGEDFTFATFFVGVIEPMIDGIGFANPGSTHHFTGAVTIDTLTATALTTAGVITLSPTASLTRYVEASATFSATDWSINSAGDFVDQTASGNYFWIPLDVPHGQTLTGVTATVLPAGGHGGLPATKPILTVAKKVISTNTASTLGTTTDPSASVLAYEVEHPIAVIGLTEVTDRRTTRYYARLTSETGANSISGMAALGISITYTRSTMGED